MEKEDNSSTSFSMVYDKKTVYELAMEPKNFKSEVFLKKTLLQLAMESTNYPSNSSSLVI
jgi:hypothetical protein